MERLTTENESLGIEMVCKYENCWTDEEHCPRINTENCQCLQDILTKLKEYQDTGLTPQEVMDGKLLTRWTPVEEGLPEEPNAGVIEIEMEDLQEYIVMIDGAELPTVLSYAGNGEWYWDGNFYRVLAWMPLPRPYRPEALREAGAEAGQDAAAQVLQSAT